MNELYEAILTNIAVLACNREYSTQFSQVKKKLQYSIILHRHRLLVVTYGSRSGVGDCPGVN